MNNVEIIFPNLPLPLAARPAGQKEPDKLRHYIREEGGGRGVLTKHQAQHIALVNAPFFQNYSGDGGEKQRERKEKSL